METSAEYLEFEVMEALNKEWTAFLDSIPWNTNYSIPESNRIFTARRNNWMKRMQRKYKVTADQLKAKYVHD